MPHTERTFNTYIQRVRCVVQCTVLRYERIGTQFVGLAGAALVASVAAVYVYEQAISVRSINMLEKRLHRCLQLSTL